MPKFKFWIKQHFFIFLILFLFISIFYLNIADIQFPNAEDRKLSSRNKKKQTGMRLRSIRGCRGVCVCRACFCWRALRIRKMTPIASPHTTMNVFFRTLRWAEKRQGRYSFPYIPRNSSKILCYLSIKDWRSFLTITSFMPIVYRFLSHKGGILSRISQGKMPGVDAIIYGQAKYPFNLMSNKFFPQIE